MQSDPQNQPTINGVHAKNSPSKANARKKKDLECAGYQHSWKEELVVGTKSSEYIQILLIKKINTPKATKRAYTILKYYHQLQTYIRILQTYKTKLYVEELDIKEYTNLGETGLNIDDLTIYSKEKEDNIDLLITVGGDGTLLWALQYFSNRSPPPILAFSNGSLGFLCNFSINNFEAKIHDVIQKISNSKPIPYEKRQRISCEVNDPSTNTKRTFQALNEIAIDRGCHLNIIKIDCYIEGKYLGSFEGDGLLISTPSGSTAYQLSAGGPIINGLLPSMCITPLNSVLITAKPLVLSSDMHLTLRISDDSRKNGFLMTDGQVNMEVTKGMDIIVTGSKFNAQFLLDENQDVLDNWISRLKNLIGWNSRNSPEEEDD